MNIFQIKKNNFVMNNFLFEFEYKTKTKTKY